MLRRWLTALAVTVGAVVAVVAVLGASACAAPPRCPPRAPAPADAAPLLWRVTGAAPGAPTLWLFGTIHHAGLPSVPPAALRALDGAARFVSELGDTEPDADVVRTWARLPRGRGLDQRLPMDDWFELRDLLRPVIREADLARARPWFAMSLLTSRVGRAPKPSMDFALAARAAAGGRPVEALETWAAQIAVIDATVDDADLLEAIRARHTMRCDLDAIRGLYAAGDAVALDRVLRGRRAATVLGARNRAWLPQLERYLAADGGGAFVAVGVAHLTGEDGLPALLAAAGYRVERVATVSARP